MPTRTVTIPAQPGFDLACLVSDPHEFIFAPIIAWIIKIEIEDGEYGEPIVRPVCADFGADTSHNLIIRWPNGTIDFAYDRSFSKGEEAAALAYAVEIENQLAKLQKKKASGS
jgi:hypothetical protein